MPPVPKEWTMNGRVVRVCVTKSPGRHRAQAPGHSSGVRFVSSHSQVLDLTRQHGTGDLPEAQVCSRRRELAELYKSFQHQPPITGSSRHLSFSFFSSPSCINWAQQGTRNGCKPAVECSSTMGGTQHNQAQPGWGWNPPSQMRVGSL